MLQRIREWLAFILLCLLPFHALLVTVGTKLIKGPGFAPLPVLALWKEGLLLLIVAIAIIDIFHREYASQPEKSAWSFDAIDWLILGGLVWASVVSMDPSTFAKLGGFSGFFTHLKFTSADKQFLLGFKYDFLPLAAFFFLRRVLWTEKWLKQVLIGLATVGAIAALYGIVTAFLPISFFTALGYSDAYSLYIPGGPLAAFQQIESSPIRRIQSVMSGPNQLGLWLLIPFSIFLWIGIKRFKSHLRSETDLKISFLLIWGFVFAAILAALMLTYSRAAWIAAAGMTFFLFILAARRAKQLGYPRRVLVLTLVSVVVAGAAAAGTLVKLRPDLLIRAQSLGGHIDRPLNAIGLIGQHPFGLGLGTAGPASNALSDVCVYQPAGSDYSWAKSRTDICIFLGNTQRYPADRACVCPLLTENWYLQFGVEMGIPGLILSILLALLVLRPLLSINLTDRALPALLAFLGVSIAGIFLHAFEDSAVAYTVWVLMSAVRKT